MHSLNEGESKVIEERAALSIFRERAPELLLVHLVKEEVVIEKVDDDPTIAEIVAGVFDVSVKPSDAVSEMIIPVNLQSLTSIEPVASTKIRDCESEFLKVEEKKKFTLTRTNFPSVTLQNCAEGFDIEKSSCCTVRVFL